MSDIVNHPPHYNTGSIEVIDAIEGTGLASDYHLACVLKYIARAKHKGRELEDLRKAQWYLTRAIRKREENLEAAKQKVGLPPAPMMVTIRPANGNDGMFT